jgi:parallel beta-helix repeat protein
VEGNVWTLQMQGYVSATNIHLQGNRLSDSASGSGGLGITGSLANVTLENCKMSGNWGDVGVQDNGIMTLKNSRVVGGDLIQATAGGKLYLLDGCQINILARVDTGASAVFENYNFIGCISGCSAGGEPSGSSGDYTLIGSNYVGGRVKFNGSINYFSRFNQIPAGFDMYDSSKIYAWWGNSFGSSQKKHSSEFWLVGSTGFDPSDPWNTMLDGDQVSNSLSWLRANDSNNTRIVRNYLTSGSIDHDKGDVRFYNNTITNFSIQQGFGGGSFLAQDNIFSGVGQGFQNMGDSTTVTGNTFKNCSVSFQTQAASVNITNNYFENNTKTISFRNASSATVSGNTLKNNTRGIRSSNTSGTLTIADNVVYSTEYNGISLNASSATISIRNNELYANNMQGTATIMFKSVSGTVAVSNNNIHDNYLSGVSYTLSNNISIYDNLIASNGLSKYEDSSGRPNASGIRAKDSTFINISGNTIRNNTYAGVSSYATDGYIGPDNTIKNNGDPTWQSNCTDLAGPGTGHGGIAVRDLEDAVISSTLIVSNNVLEDNYISTIAWKDCRGTIRLDGTDWTRCGGSNPSSSDAKVFVASNYDIFVDGVSVANSSVVECGVTPGVPASITGGNPWGIAITPGATGITVKNCSIYNNNTILNDYGPNGTHFGGGLFVGLDTEALIYSNVIYNNGVGYQNPDVLEEGGHAGVVLACAPSEATLKNNKIYDNSRDGVNIRGGSPTIGILGGTNEIYDNGRHGIGCSGSAEATIAYNFIDNNTRLGIGNRESAAPTIQNNTISNHIAFQKTAGVGMIDQSAPYVYSNWLFSNEHGVGFGNGNAVRDNTLANQSGVGTNEVKLDAGASTIDNKYNDKLLVLDDTAIGSPKEALITDYDGTTKVATINLSWSTVPSSTDLYRIFNMGYQGTVLVKDNIIYSSRRDGIGIWGASLSNITMDGNDIQDSVDGGVSMRYVEDSQLTIANSPTINNSNWSVRGEYNTDNTLVIDNNPYIANGYNIIQDLFLR